MAELTDEKICVDTRFNSESNIANQVRLRYKAELDKYPNIVATGVGFVYEKGVRTDEIGIIANVAEKHDLSALRMEDVIPGSYDNIRVDVQKSKVLSSELPELEASEQSLTGYVDKLTTGYSIGAKVGVTAGTTGYFGRRNGKVVVTSNCHVFAGDVNKDISEQVSLDIIQPGKYDGGSEVRAIFSGMQKIFFKGEGKVNKIDSACADIIDPEDYTLDIPYIGRCEGYDSSLPRLGELIDKVGRTTGYTHGYVEQIHVDANINYNGNIAVFKDLILTRSMSSGGDSGAIGYVDKKMKYRLFAGSSQVTLFFHLAEELVDLNITPLIDYDDDIPDGNTDDIVLDFEMEPVDEEPDTKNIRGIVRTTSGNVLANVDVTLFKDGNIHVHTKSDKDGKYHMDEVTQHDYTLELKHDGYVTITMELEEELFDKKQAKLV